MTGADLTTRDGMFTLRYEYGNDRITGAWNNIGGFVNIGFQMENIIKGESPFTTPEPIFKSPRNIRRMLTQKVKRNWNQPAAMVVSRSSKVLRCGTFTVSGSFNPAEFVTPITSSELPGTVTSVRIQIDFSAPIVKNYTVRADWAGTPTPFGLLVFSPDGTAGDTSYDGSGDVATFVGHLQYGDGMRGFTFRADPQAPDPYPFSGSYCVSIEYE